MTTTMKSKRNSIDYACCCECDMNSTMNMSSSNSSGTMSSSGSGTMSSSGSGTMSSTMTTMNSTMNMNSTMTTHNTHDTNSNSYYYYDFNTTTTTIHDYKTLFLIYAATADTTQFDMISNSNNTHESTHVTSTHVTTHVTSTHVTTTHERWSRWFKSFTYSNSYSNTRHDDVELMNLSKS